MSVSFYQEMATIARTKNKLGRRQLTETTSEEGEHKAHIVDDRFWDHKLERKSQDSE